MTLTHAMRNWKVFKKSIIEHYFYKILVDGKFSGAVYVHENPDKLHMKLHTIYVLPEYQILVWLKKQLNMLKKYIIVPWNGFWKLLMI